MGVQPRPRAPPSRPRAARPDPSQFSFLSGRVGPRLVQDPWASAPVGCCFWSLGGGVTPPGHRGNTGSPRVAGPLSQLPHVGEERSCLGCESRFASSQWNLAEQAGAPLYDCFISDGT